MRRTTVVTPFTWGRYVSVAMPIRTEGGCGWRVKHRRRRCYGSVTLRGGSKCSWSRELRHGSGGREHHPDRRPPARRALGPHPPAVHLHEMLDDSEAEAGASLIARAGRVRPIEPLEHPRQVLARDPRPVVGHGHERAAWRGAGVDDDAAFPPRWRVAQGIVEEVRENLPEGIGVGGEGGPGRRDVDGKGDLAVPGPIRERRPRLRRDGRHGRGPGGGLPAARR